MHYRKYSAMDETRPDMATALLFTEPGEHNPNHYRLITSFYPVLHAYVASVKLEVLSRMPATLALTLLSWLLSGRKYKRFESSDMQI